MSNNETTEKADISDTNPPKSGINPNMKMEILLFKNEVLTDIKKTEKLIADRYSKMNESLEEKFLKYEQKLDSLNEKIQGITSEKSVDNNLNENVSKLLTFRDSTKDNLITTEIKIRNLEKDLNNNVYRIDKILAESVIYPRVIGGISKFKTFHDFMDYILTQASQNITFRDKSQLDLKTYKVKLENLIKNFKYQLDNLMKEANAFTKRSISECEDRIKLLFDRVDERIRDTRVENANFMLDFQKTVDDLKQEIVSIGELKKEIMKKFDEELLLIKHDNKNVVDTFGNYKQEFYIMKDRLTQLALFIKDVRFRTNIRKSEFHNMANKIDFDKKQNLKDNKYAESDELFKDDWLNGKNSMVFESGLKKYIKGEIGVNEIGIIHSKEKTKPKNSLDSSNNTSVNNNMNNFQYNSDNNINNNINKNNLIREESIKKKKNLKNKEKKEKTEKTEFKDNKDMKKKKKIKIKKRRKNNDKNGNEEENEEEEEIEDEETEEEEEKEEEEEEEEEYEEDSNQNLSCDYIDEFSDENEYEEKIKIVEGNQRGIKRRKSKIGLPMIHSKKRGTSAKNKKKISNNYAKYHMKDNNNKEKNNKDKNNKDKNNKDNNNKDNNKNYNNYEIKEKK